MEGHIKLYLDMHLILINLSCKIKVFSIFIIVILVSAKFTDEADAVLAFTNPVLTFMFLLLYASALITFLFALSTLFDKRKIILSNIFCCLSNDLCF